MAYQDDLRNFMNGGRSSLADNSNPLLTQVAQGASLPGMNTWSRILPNHPRLTAALENATMMASMIPGADTTGGNIAQVAGAFMGLPQARMNRALSLMQPQLQMEQMQADQLAKGATAYNQYNEGNYYAGRNASEQADRDQRSAAALAALHGGMADNKPYFGAGVAEADDVPTQPGVKPRWQTGDTVYGNYISQWDDGKGYPVQKFVPTHTAAEGEQLNSLGLMRPETKWMYGIQGIMDDAEAKGKHLTPNQAMTIYDQRNALDLFGAHQAAPPSVSDVTNQNSLIARQADEKTYTSSRYANMAATSDERKAYTLTHMNDPNFDIADVAGPSPEQRQQVNAKIDSLYAAHAQLKGVKPSFEAYLKQNGFDATTRTFKPVQNRTLVEGKDF